MLVTDGETDGQNYDSQDRASIAASRGKNWTNWRRNIKGTSSYSIKAQVSGLLPAGNVKMGRINDPNIGTHFSSTSLP